MVVVFKERNFEGWQERAQLGAGRLLEIEEINSTLTGEETGIQLAYKYWSSLKIGGRVPEARFDLGVIGGNGAAVSMIDVTPDNPYQYVFRQYRLSDYAFMHGKPLAEFPHRRIASRCAGEYLHVKDSRAPCGHHVSHDLNGFRREYLRLLLPLTDRSGRVSALACVSRHLDRTAPPESLPSIPDATNTPAEHH